MNADSLVRAFADRGLETPMFLAQTASTNTDAKALAAQGAAEGVAVIAGEQTQGRGRLGRSWLASPDGSLALSVIVRPRVPLSRLAYLVLGAGVAVAEACGPAARLKWPNDVLSPDGRKMAGILAEADFGDPDRAFVILGIGVNVTEVPPDLPAACVAEIGGAVGSREALAAAIVDGVVALARLAERDPAAVRERWLARDVTIGRRVRASGIQGIAVALAADGGLEVRGDDGEVRWIRAGDVEIVSGLGGRDADR